MSYRVLIFFLGLLFQSSPSLENQIAEDIIYDYLETMPTHNQDRNFFVSEVLDSVFVRRYQRVLNPQNDFIYKDFTVEQKNLIQNLLQIKEPLPFDISKLTEQQKFKIRPLKEKVGDDWDDSKIKVSRISISPDGDEACLILEYVCGSKCGVGVLIFAQIENKSWKMVSIKRLWIA
jgi:hypothetical protein